MKNKEGNTSKRFKLSDVDDEKLREFMKSLDTDEDDDGDLSSGEEFNPDYISDEISAENELCISQAKEMNAGETSGSFIQADDLPITALSTLVETVEAGEPTEILASTSSRFKPQKRAQSPLPSVEDSGPDAEPSAVGFTGSDIREIRKDSAEFSKMIWVKRSMRLHVNEVAFRGNSQLPSSFKMLDTPLKLFKYFFTDKIIDMIVQETNRAAFQESINTVFSTDSFEVHHYIGILMFMSVYRYPNLESYWGKNAFLPIQNTMPIRRFKMIKKYLSFQDETERIRRGAPGYDRLFRIRKLASELNVQFDSIPKTSRLCVDEQMCSTKIKHHLRQYMPNKPHKWGIKLFVLCDSHGFAYRFEIYNGAGDNCVLPGTPDLGATSNVVVRLTESIPNFVHHIVYFDNFYTSLPLLVYLRSRGIYSLGTMRANRIPNCKLPLDKDIQDKPRGYSTEYVAPAYGVDISTVLWKDSKSVRLASTYVGVEPFAKANPNKQTPKAARYDRKQKQFIEVDCPQIIREYNSHMGGVDLMDGLMGRYHIRTKTRNPMMRLFYHFIDMASTNAYILYRRIHADKCNDSTEDEKLLKLPEFREEIAAALIMCSEKRKVGRPLTVPRESNVSQPSTSGIGKKAKHPVQDIRFDGCDHIPVWLSKNGGKKKCKLCKTSQTQCICQKCDLHLCCSYAKNCFYDYHYRK